MTSHPFFEPKPNNAPPSGAKLSPADELIPFLNQAALPSNQNPPSGDSSQLEKLNPNQLLSLASEHFSDIRVLVKYLVFDVESTGREHAYLLRLVRDSFGDAQLSLADPKLALFRKAFTAAEAGRAAAGVSSPVETMEKALGDGCTTLAHVLKHLSSSPQLALLEQAQRDRVQSQLTALQVALDKVQQMLPPLLEKQILQSRGTAELRYIIEAMAQDG